MCTHMYASAGVVVAAGAGELERFYFPRPLLATYAGALSAFPRGGRSAGVTCPPRGGGAPP